MQPATATPPNGLDDPALYINRELSWLEFNRRVLEEAQDPTVPLLERLKFLAIFESNLDEFFMVRVGGLQQKVQLGIAYGSGADRMPVKEQLERIGQTVRRMTDECYHCFQKDVMPALEREGIPAHISWLKAQMTCSERKLTPSRAPTALGGRAGGFTIGGPATPRSSSPSSRCRPCCRASSPCRPRRAARATSSPRWRRSSACTCRCCSPA